MISSENVTAILTDTQQGLNGLYSKDLGLVKPGSSVSFNVLYTGKTEIAGLVPYCACTHIDFNKVQVPGIEPDPIVINGKVDVAELLSWLPYVNMTMEQLREHMKTSVRGPAFRHSVMFDIIWNVDHLSTNKNRWVLRSEDNPKVFMENPELLYTRYTLEFSVDLTPPAA